MPKPTRSLTDVQTEYAQLCARVGELEWKRRAMTRELEDDLYPRLAALNLEAARMQKSNPKPKE